MDPSMVDSREFFKKPQGMFMSHFDISSLREHILYLLRFSAVFMRRYAPIIQLRDHWFQMRLLSCSFWYLLLFQATYLGVLKLK